MATKVRAVAPSIGSAVPTRAWPAWQVPAGALSEWIALVTALLELGAEPACADEPERWWSKQPADVAYAQLVCALCPVRSWCQSYAIAAGERDGVWGGLTRAERVADGAVSP
jgi:Transcription factor WhiB